MANPKNRLILGLNNHNLLRWMTDESNIKLVYKAQLNKKLDLSDPKTFNEKLQWIKLYDRNPAYCQMVDKYDVRKFVANRIGEEYLIPCYGVWEKPEDIDFSELPDEFVLKCTHDSGSVFICKDKKKINIEDVKSFFRKHLKKGSFYYGREWPYKNLKPRIVAEKLLKDNKSDDLFDYKIHCFNGEPKVILVCSERFKSGLKEDWFDTKWEHLPIHRPKHKNADVTPEKPVCLDEMLELAKELSKGLPFSRIDFYVVNAKIYFGEITFFPASGYTAFVPEEYDRILGDWIMLPEK